MKKELKKFLNQKIVVDTKTSWMYIGTLEKLTDHCVLLKDVDAHDNADTPTSKEIYLLKSKINDIVPNRNCVFINLDHVVSFSPLEDIREY